MRDRREHNESRAGIHLIFLSVPFSSRIDQTNLQSWVVSLRLNLSSPVLAAGQASFQCSIVSFS